MTINGAPVPVGADGRFSASVPLQPGANEIARRGRGLDRPAHGPDLTLVRLPPQPPELTPVPRPLWKP